MIYYIIDDEKCFEIGKTYYENKELTNRNGYIVYKNFDLLFYSGKVKQNSIVYEVEVTGSTVNSRCEIHVSDIFIRRQTHFNEIINKTCDKIKVLHCIYEEDMKELWSTIKDGKSKVKYCFCVKDRKELWSTIEDDYYKYLYCMYKKDRKELWSKITDDEYKYFYCRNVQNRKELWSTIIDGYWRYEYCKNIKNRPELNEKGWN